MLLYFYRILFTNVSSQELYAVSAYGILISLEQLPKLSCIAQCPFTGVGAVAIVGIQSVSDLRPTIGKDDDLLAI